MFTSIDIYRCVWDNSNRSYLYCKLHVFHNDIYEKGDMKSVHGKIVFFTTIFLISIAGYAERLSVETILLDETFSFINITPKIRYFEDHGGTLTIDDITARNKDWRALNVNTTRFGYSRSAFWYTFTLENRMPRDGGIYLEIDFPTVDYIDLYIPDGKGGWIHKEAGDMIPFKNRDIPDRNFVFTIPENKTYQSIYVRIQTLGSHKYSFLLKTPEFYLDTLGKILSVYWIVWGWFLLLVLYNIFIYFSTQERIYLLFIIPASVTGMEQFIIRGFGAQYLFPSGGKWINITMPFLWAVMIFSGTQFYRLFLGSKKLFPKMDRLIVWIIQIPAFVMMILSLFLPVDIIMQAVLYIFLLEILLIVIIMVRAALKKVRQAYFLMAGFVPIFVISIHGILLTLGFTEGNFLKLYGIEFTLSGVIFFSSLGLADKLNILKKNLEKSEAQVREQNSELMAANEELVATNEEFEAQNEELMTAYRSLEAEEQRFSEMTGMLPQAVYEMELNGKLTYVNEFGFDMTGYTSDDLKRGMNALDLLVPEDREKAAENFISILANSDVHPHDYTVMRRDGTTIPVLIYTRTIMRDGSQKGFRGVIIDITERKRAEAVLIQNEKMMTVGGLAAGMAHEINNPLGIILQGVQNTIRRFSPEQETNRNIAEEMGLDLVLVNRYMEERRIAYYLRSIEEAGNRAGDIIANMLNFSRRSRQEFYLCNIHSLIDEAISLAEKDYDLKKKYDFRHIEIVRNYFEGLPKLEIQKTEMEQVLLNLLKNSAQAMGGMAEDRGRPRITISTALSGDRAVITIADNGPGMDEDMSRHVFEPFYTTKPVGEGTGLGLSVVYFIITGNHKGTIEVVSQKGFGTTFIIGLPLSRK